MCTRRTCGSNRIGQFSISGGTLDGQPLVYVGLMDNTLLHEWRIQDIDYLADCLSGLAYMAQQAPFQAAVSEARA